MPGEQLPLLLFGSTGATAAAAEIAFPTIPQKPLKRFGPSNLIVDQVPDFINRDHESFRRFVEAYYEWMEQLQNPYGIIDAFMDLMDVDRSVNLFINDFRAMYLQNFPAQLAFDAATGNVVSEGNFLKNARKFYGAKGTEKAFKFLFRLIYNVASEFYYPARDILKVSDGVWKEPISIKTTSNNGSVLYSIAGSRVYQTDPVTGNVSAYATVTDVVQYRKGQYDVAEFFIKDIFGSFLTTQPLKMDISGSIYQEDIHPVITSVDLLNGGALYSPTDVVAYTYYGDGVGLSIRVGSINDKGRILDFLVEDSGVGYRTDIELAVASNTGNGTASAIARTGAVSYYPGYYASNNGKLSSSKKLFDGYYYQNFSYVLRSEISLSTYKEMYKKLVHPAGFKMFGEVLVKRNIIDNLPFHSEMQRYELPFIGHYTPYRIGTTADLYDLYIDGFNPHGETFSSFQNYGGTGGKLFVTPVGFTFNGGITWADIRATGAAANVIVGDVFEFERIGQTSGVLLLKTIDFDLFNISATTGAGFVEGSQFTMFDDGAVGYTATIERVRYGMGIVPETGGNSHDTMGAPLGSSGTDGYIEASGFSYAYWRVYHHPNIRGIKGLTGVWEYGSTGAGASFGSIALNPFFRMPIGYHFHSNPSGTPYEGTTGTNNEYGLIESSTLTSPNF